MRFWVTAEEETRFKVSRHFVRWWQMLGFLIVSLFLLFFFFPKEQLLHNIAQQRRADVIARQYLQHLVTLYPKEKNYTLLLIEQKLQAGELSGAISAIMSLVVEQPKTEIDWKALSLYYKILRVQTYAKPEVSYARRQGIQKMRELITVLQRGPLNAEDLLMIGDDLVKMDNPQAALSVYQRLLTLPQKQCAHDCAELYAAAGRFMLGYRNYRGSAAFYFLAQDSAEALDKKRNYFMLAVKSLQAGDLLELAVTESNKNVGDLVNDKQTLIFLSRLALAANKPKLANDYVNRILRLKVHAPAKE
jgi:hypothetical protein